MMDGGMSSMMNSIMGWMMGIGALGWVLVIALLVTIVVGLARMLSRAGDRPDRTSAGSDHSSRSES